MQLNDTKIEEFGRNDGIKSISHCQEKFFISYNLLTISPTLKIASKIQKIVWTYHNELNLSTFVIWIQSAKALLYQVNSNAYYTGQQRQFISLKEEFHKLESEIELQHFQNIVRRNRDSNDAKMNQNVKKS